MPNTTTCRSCGSKMQFAMTAKGRRMPLDAEPDIAGTWTIDDDGMLTRATAETPADQKFRSHFETCPQGRGWSARGKRGTS